MEASPVVWEAVTDPAELWRLKPEWDALWRAADGDHVQTERACFHAWNNDGDPSPRRLHAIAGWREGRLVFLWPLVVRRRHGLWSMVTQLGPQAGELTSVLTEPGPEAVPRMAAAWAFMKRTSRADIVWLDYIKLGSPLHQVVTADPTRIGGVGINPDIAPYVRWPETMGWDEYYASLSANMRRTFGKKYRGLAKIGEVTFAAETDPQRRVSLARWILEQKRHWANKTGKHGPWLTAAAYDGFLRDLAEDPAATDCIVFALSVNGEVVAAMLTSMSTRHMDWIIAGYDPAWSHHSPGLVLNEHGLRWAHERGLTVELGRGAEINKRFWSRGACHDILSFRLTITRRGALIDALRTTLARTRHLLRPKAGLAAPEAEPTGRRDDGAWVQLPR